MKKICYTKKRKKKFISIKNKTVVILRKSVRELMDGAN